MKKYLLLLLGISLLSLHPAQAQDSNPKIVPVIQETNSLPRFDLDFAGGTPGDLVRVIEQASRKPLNAIIPDDCANVKIPRISVKNVTVAQLFEAVTSASKDTRRFASGNSALISAYGFRTESRPDENSIWYFYWDKLVDSTPPVVCRFYQLSPYLEAGYKVEDITTAIETAWKMLGITRQPEIKYHKDTKLLIAVGGEDKLLMIDEALRQLSRGSPVQKPSNSHDSEKSKTK